MATLSEEEIRKMREMLAAHDAEASNEADFDPSKVKVPYRFQKFPMMVYDHAESYPAYDTEKDVMRGSVVVRETVHVKAHLAEKVVRSQAELDHALAHGWSEAAPHFREEAEAEEPEEQLSVQEHRARGRKPGRKPKEVAA